MLKDEFFNALALHLVHPDKSNMLWQEIEEAYCGAGRHYHNLTHLEHLLQEVAEIKSLVQEWETLIFSIAYHDIIYNPLNKNNEERSAEIASSRLEKLAIPGAQIHHCRAQILATKTHELQADHDANYLLDADLTILGAAPEDYLNYSKQIRKEYAVFPSIIYKPGRKKVLQHFLNMPYIFKTTHFRRKYETVARANLLQELQQLTL